MSVSFSFTSASWLKLFDLAYFNCATLQVVSRDRLAEARIDVERQASTPKSFNTLRYSAAMGDDTLADAETFAEPFAALVSSSGLSEWRDFPSK